MSDQEARCSRIARIRRVGYVVPVVSTRKALAGAGCAEKTVASRTTTQACCLGYSAPDAFPEIRHSVRECLTNFRAGLSLPFLANSGGPVGSRIELGLFTPASQAVAPPLEVGHVRREISVEVLLNSPLVVILVSHRLSHRGDPALDIKDSGGEL